ncbi:MAG: thiamine ABC transporter substrate binding subunit [Gammaproteobacteria bacterium]|nr:MAG: thiamine ABC transporter substrate binding subunit [Gammaproteobacteria bacterium]
MKKIIAAALINLSVLTGITYASDAAELPTLTIYSYDSFTADWGPGPALGKAFEAECDCQVKWVPFGDGITMFNRLRLEGKQPKADVVIGLDNNLLKTAMDSGLFAENNLDLSRLQLPIAWENQTFIPYDYGQYAFIYDKTKLNHPPTSLKALIADENLSIIYQDPRTSTVGRGLLAWVNRVYPDNAAKAWQQLAKHTVTVGKGWSETYGAFLKGEADMVLSYNTSPLYHQINEDNNNYAAAEFAEGHIVQIELAGRLTTAKHPQLAERFLGFLLSPEAQKIIALKNIMLPVIDVAVEPRFDAFKPAKTLAVPQPDKATSKQRLKVWQSAVSR